MFSFLISVFYFLKPIFGSQVHHKTLSRSFHNQFSKTWCDRFTELTNIYRLSMRIVGKGFLNIWKVLEIKMVMTYWWDRRFCQVSWINALVGCTFWNMPLFFWTKILNKSIPVDLQTTIPAVDKACTCSFLHSQCCVCEQIYFILCKILKRSYRRQRVLRESQN